MFNLWDPHGLIFEKFEKSMAVPDMAQEPSSMTYFFCRNSLHNIFDS